MKRDFRYAEDWDAQAYEVKKAAGFRCTHCHAKSSWKRGRVLTVHHRDGNPANNAPENKVALCQVCHLRVKAGTLTLDPAQLQLRFT